MPFLNIISTLIGNNSTGGASSSGLPDYLGANLYDWWQPQRGVIADVNGVDMDSWDGYVNNTRLTPVQTTEDIPANGVWTMNLTNGGLVLPNNPGFAASDYTFAFYLRKNGAHNAPSWLLDTVGPTPRCILKFEIGVGAPNAGIQFNGIDYDFGYAIPKDTTYRVIAFVFSGTTCKLMVDGVQQGNTITGLTGGQITLNTSTTRRLFRGGSVILNPFNGDIKGFRIYREAVSDSNIALFSGAGSAFTNPIPQNPARLYNLIGQSNIEGSGASSGMPGYLSGVLPRCYLWDNNTRVFIPLNITNYTLSSPIFEFAYRMSLKYPTDDIMIVMGAVGGTSLAVDWLAPSGARYVTNKARVDQAMVQLGIQVRQPGLSSRGIVWGQGETDAQVQVNADAYATNEAALYTQLRTDFGDQIIAACRLHSTLPAGSYPYRTTVNTAKDTTVGLNANNRLFNTDNSTTYPVGGDNLHYTATGMVAIGNQFSTYF